jgi:hypothetical protein
MHAILGFIAAALFYCSGCFSVEANGQPRDFKVAAWSSGIALIFLALAIYI